MNTYEITNNTLRKYIFFSNVSPQIKNPLIISILFHGLILITGLLIKPNDSIVEEFTVEIINTPVEMSVKNYTRISNLRDQSKKAKNVQIKKNLLQADPGSLMNGNKTENSSGFDTQDQSFVDKYENILFNRKNANLSENKAVNENKNNMKWDESGKDISHSDKNSISETAKIPTGRGESKDINWKTGYSRKIIFQPDIEYPVYFRKQGIQASVRLIIDVDALGNVVNAEVLQSSGYPKLDILARSGILKAKFLKRDNFNNTLDRGEVEVQYKLE
ncbi:MAG: TonB family protein [Spirochaetia bacterium]|nr:TonB family protein [Spirochaetia bacterium]